MNAAGDLLDHLARIGATVKPAGDRLILRAGPTAIPATLVNRVREAKADLIATLAPRTVPNVPEEQEDAGEPTRHQSKRRTFEGCIVEWLNQHPTPSAPGRCAWCGMPESPDAIVLPFGTEPGTHVWLHAECGSAWYAARKAGAVTALAAIGLVAPVGHVQTRIQDGKKE
jgi:hypothetical protein